MYSVLKKSAGTNLGLDDRENVLRLEGLGHVGMSADQAAFEAIKYPVALREDHDRRQRAGRFGLEQPDDFIAVQFGQAEINEDEIGGACLGSIEPEQRLHAVLKALDLVA